MKDKFSKKIGGDVSLYNDLISLLEELICAEKHAVNNIELDSNRSERWKEIAKRLREIRFKWQGLLDDKKYENTELHCWSKHCLASSKNFIEVGNKLEGISNYSDQAYNDHFEVLNLIIEMNNLDAI